MRTISKGDIIGVTIFLVVLVLFGFWSTTREKRKFNKEGRLTKGIFVSYRHYSPARLSMTYSYKVNGKKYTRNTTLIEYPQKSENIFLNKSFPVIYLKNHPEESRILCSESRFKYFDIDFPDSLEWTKKFVLK